MSKPAKVKIIIMLKDTINSTLLIGVKFKVIVKVKCSLFV